MYNIENLIKAVSTLYETANGDDSYSIDYTCDVIKQELNRLLPDFTCTEVIYNPNYDKKFFGLFVLPNVYRVIGDYIDKVLAGYDNIKEYFEPFKFKEYTLEIDGKLLRKFNLSYSEILALIIQDICALNTPQCTSRLRNTIDAYIALNNKDRLCINCIRSYPRIFEMVTIITIHNITSVFTRYGFSPEDDINDIVRDGLGLYKEFKSAYSKLLTSGSVEEVNTNNVLLSWYLENYKNFTNGREAEYMFRKAIEVEASRVVKNLIFKSIDNINGVDNNDKRYYGELVQESKRKGLLYTMKRNGLKSIEEDLYEYNMRLRNVETQDEAILLMRQINSRMSILEEYLEEEDMDEKDKERWTACYKKYLEIREALSKKTVYNKKMYGLFVDYNALQNMNDNGNFMNTYY